MMYPLPENRTFKRSKMSTNISFFCLPPDCAVDHRKYKRKVSIWVLCASKGSNAYPSLAHQI